MSTTTTGIAWTDRTWNPIRGCSSVIRTACAMGNPHGLVATSGHPTPKPESLMKHILAVAAPDIARHARSTQP